MKRIATSLLFVLCVAGNSIEAARNRNFSNSARTIKMLTKKLKMQDITRKQKTKLFKKENSFGPALITAIAIPIGGGIVGLSIYNIFRGVDEIVKV
jgi:hypothetical protein